MRNTTIMKTAMAVKTATDMFGVLYWCRSSVRVRRKISGRGDVGAVGRSRATWRRSRVGKTRNRRWSDELPKSIGSSTYIILYFSTYYRRVKKTEFATCEWALVVVALSSRPRARHGSPSSACRRRWVMGKKY